MNMDWLKPTVTIMFILTYVGILLLPKYRHVLALGVAAIFLGFGLFIPESYEFATIVQAIDWNVILMIMGTMITVHYFIASQAPVALADMLVKRLPTVKWVILVLAFFSGIVSAFIDNVATVLIVAPIALTIAKRLKISPVPLIIAITVSANLQGFATLVGDTTSIVLGGIANMNFADFFWFEGRPGPFFIVQAGALMTVLVLMFLFRKLNQPIHIEENVQVKDKVPSVLLVLIVIGLVSVSFIEDKPALTNGIVTMTIAVIAMVYDGLRQKSFSNAKAVIQQLDYQTLFLLIGLFMIIATLSTVGVITDIANLFVTLGGANPFVLFTLVVWISVLLSAFIDNIPYVVTMLPVMAALAVQLNVNPILLYFGLLAGATLGGNLTPIGASANIAGIGLLRKEGYEVKYIDFARIAIPMTLVAVTTAYVLIWLLWS